MRIADRVTALRMGEYVKTAEISGITAQDIAHMMIGRNLNGLTRKRKHLGAAALEAEHINVLKGNRSVFVDSGMIAHVEYRDLNADLEKAGQVIDAQGSYLIPGFIDAHEHIESSMMTPRNFARAVILCGTTTVIADPHEMENVWGMEGVRCSRYGKRRRCISCPGDP